MKVNKHLYISIFCIVVALLIYVSYAYFNCSYDSVIYEYFYEHRNNTVVTFIKFASGFGGYYMAIILIILLLSNVMKQRIKYMMLINIALNTMLNLSLKSFIQRARPYAPAIEISGYSFPSGHAMASTAFYGYLIYIVSQSNVRYKPLIYTAGIFVIAVVCFSRIYLGVHYTSDVLAGIFISLSYLHLLIYYTKKVHA